VREEIEQRRLQHVAQAPERPQRGLALAQLDLTQRGWADAHLFRQRRQREMLPLPQAAHVASQLLPQRLVEAAHAREPLALRCNGLKWCFTKRSLRTAQCGVKGKVDEKPRMMNAASMKLYFIRSSA
jgi:hypothetical protein